MLDSKCTDERVQAMCDLAGDSEALDLEEFETLMRSGGAGAGGRDELLARARADSDAGSDDLASDEEDVMPSAMSLAARRATLARGVPTPLRAQHGIGTDAPAHSPITLAAVPARPWGLSDDAADS